MTRPIATREIAIDAIVAERRRMQAAGFLGNAVPWLERAEYEVADAGHVLRVTLYRFPDWTERPYVEVAEAHGGAYSARIWPLPEAVHLLQNVSEGEFWRIGGRERAVPARPTHAQLAEAGFMDDEIEAADAQRPSECIAVNRTFCECPKCVEERRGKPCGAVYASGSAPSVCTLPSGHGGRHD